MEMDGVQSGEVGGWRKLPLLELANSWTATDYCREGNGNAIFCGNHDEGKKDVAYERSI